MSRLLRRPTRTICFFCQSEVQPRDPRSFRCSQCGCWNRYDAHGEIVSDEPAMHDESMNARSFAKRASPRKDRFLPTYGSVIFCHTCQTNQMLVSNLLSNYLPLPDDPEYAQLNAQLPAYRTSLETRYPPICASCLPAVEEEIKRRDRMARTSALGTLLKQSKGKGKERQRQNSGSLVRKRRAALERELLIWRVRGVLWVTMLIGFLSAYGFVLSGSTTLQLPVLLYKTSPVIVFLSIIWTAWDPRYATFKRSQIQGREVRLRAKREYNSLQTFVWLSRLLTTILVALSAWKPTWDILYAPNSTASLSLQPRALWYYRVSIVLELCILIRSVVILRIDTPPPVRLMEQYSHRPSLPPSDTSSQYPSRHTTPMVDPAQELISSLTLSNNPILMNLTDARSSTTSPVFGQPSLTHVNGHANGQSSLALDPMEDETGFHDTDDPMDEEDEDAERDPDAMDWSPIHPVQRSQRRARALGDRSNSMRREDVNLRPQRFFAPEEPTGLEGLFEKTIKLGDDDLVRREEMSKQTLWRRWFGSTSRS